MPTIDTSPEHPVSPTSPEPPKNIIEYGDRNQPNGKNPQMIVDQVVHHTRVRISLSGFLSCLFLHLILILIFVFGVFNGSTLQVFFRHYVKARQISTFMQREISCRTIRGWGRWTGRRLPDTLKDESAYLDRKK